MGAKGFQGEESSVWVELGEGFVGAGRRKPFPGVEQLRVSSEQSRERAGAGRRSFFVLNTLPLPPDHAGHSDPSSRGQGVAQIMGWRGKG